jgi:inner membrane protein
MDSITQGLLGATAAIAVTPKRLTRQVAWLGAFAGVLPDFDVVIRSSHNPLIFLTYHRGFTHSLIFMPLGALIAWVIWLLFSKNCRNHWGWFLLAALVAYATHAPLDCLTSYGTEIFWPFSNVRIALNTVSIVDPVVSITLLVGVIIAMRRSNNNPARIAIGIFLLYLSFGAWQNHRALHLQNTIIAKRQQVALQRRVQPMLGNVFTWFSVYKTKKQIIIDKIVTPLFSQPYYITGISLPAATINNLPNKIKNNPSALAAFKTIDWFTKGYIGILNLHPYTIADLHILTGFNPLKPLWAFQIKPGNRQIVDIVRRPTVKAPNYKSLRLHVH